MSELTGAEVAIRLGLSSGRIRQLVMAGLLHPRQDPRTGWNLYHEADVARYEKGRRPKPAPQAAGDNPAGSIVTRDG